MGKKRKAAAYDRLAELNAELVEALLNLYYYVSRNIDSGFPKGIQINGAEFIAARAALTKADAATKEMP